VSTTNPIAAHPTLPGHDILVCIFQRGAADGLNAVVPYTDPDYAGLHRPTIAVPPPVDMNDPRYLTTEYALRHWRAPPDTLAFLGAEPDRAGCGR
jgi:uncharacterized protein (DUF1501 family)